MVEAVDARDESALDEVFAQVARGRVTPFRGAFPDFRMRIVGIIAEADTVVAHFTASPPEAS